MRQYYSEESNSITIFTDNYAKIGDKTYVYKECSKLLNEALTRLETHLKKHAIELCE